MNRYMYMVKWVQYQGNKSLHYIFTIELKCYLPRLVFSHCRKYQSVKITNDFDITLCIAKLKVKNFNKQKIRCFGHWIWNLFHDWCRIFYIFTRENIKNTFSLKRKIPYLTWKQYHVVSLSKDWVTNVFYLYVLIVIKIA